MTTTKDRHKKPLLQVRVKPELRERVYRAADDLEETLSEVVEKSLESSTFLKMLDRRKTK